MKGNYTKSEHFEIIDTLGVPHPYMITHRHVIFASDHYSGRLGDEAVRAAEQQGITCGVRGCQLSWDQHRQALLVACKAPLTLPDGTNNPELEAYLKANVKEAEANDYEGFAFLDKRESGGHG